MKFLKRNFDIVFTFAFLAVIFAASAADAFPQTTLARKCPGAAPSPASAIVDIEKDGDINIRNCNGRTTTITGTIATSSTSWALANGTAAAPSFSFSSDTDTGMFRSGANALGFSTGGTERATLSSAGLLTITGGVSTTTGLFTGTVTRTQGTITTSQPFSTHTATWNDSGVTFVNDFSNVTDTASAAGSLLMDRQVGGTSMFKVTKAGVVTTGSNIELGHASDTTLSRSSAGVLAVEGTSVSLNSTSATHTAGTVELGAATDTTLARSAAGTVTIEGNTVQTSADFLKSYLAANVVYNNTATLADTNLSITVASAGIYEISAVLHSSNIARSPNVDFAGTATATNFIGGWTAHDAAQPTTTEGLRATSLGTDFSCSTCDSLDAVYQFTGTLEVSGGGTVLIRGAQHTASATNTTILRGSVLTARKLN